MSRAGGTAANWHACAPSALRRLPATAGPAGLLLGQNQAGAFVPVRALRPQPTRIALVGGAWAARLLVFRAVALGAAINVITGTPSRWADLDRLAGADGHIVLGPPVDAGPASSQRPVLNVYDVGPTPPAERAPIRPWQTRLTVLPRLHPTARTTVADANIVLLQKLSPDEAALCGSILHLPATTTDLLQRMHDDMVAIIAPGVVGYLWLAPSSVETAALGPATRT